MLMRRSGAFASAVGPFVYACAFGFLFVTGGSAAAQQGTQVRGTLTNALSNAPIAGAALTLEEITRQTKSAADGSYVFEGVPAGSYHLLVTAAGFLQKRQEVTVGATPVTMDVEVAPELHYSEVVSVSPEARNQFDSFQSTNVIAGQELAKDLQGSLGATLENEPGVATRTFGGPGPSRPVIRGLDGDRVLILEDGLRTGDLSSQSGDHATTINPASATRIEVVRGPATLLYGANAIGGLVNVISNDIPTAPVTGATGSFTLEGATATSEGAGAGDVTAGNGAFAIHVGGSGRRAGDYDTPEGRIDNSYSRTGVAQVGVSYTSSKGYLGGAFQYDKTHLGLPVIEEGNVSSTPRRRNFTLRGERNSMGGFVNSIRASVAYRGYRHDELEGDEIGTAFKNTTTEVLLMVGHRQVGRLKGAFGATTLNRAFTAAGAEILSPPVDQNGVAAFFYEEVTSPHVTFQFGGRVDHSKYTPKEELDSRDFTNYSGSLGLLVHPSDATTIAVSAARASRYPALEELYYHGPHTGTFTFENGDENLVSEHALGFDVAFRWRHARTSGEVAYFFNQIDNFIFRRVSGEIIEDLPETFYSQGDGRLQGIESHIDVQLTNTLLAEGGLDYVRGELTTTDEPLQRTPPLRGRVGLRFQRNAFQAGGDVTMTAKQDRVSGFELPTDGYNLLKLYGSYSFTGGRTTNTITLRLDNATNELYHNHLNYLKDFVPELGRRFRVIYSTKF